MNTGESNDLKNSTIPASLTGFLSARLPPSPAKQQVTDGSQATNKTNQWRTGVRPSASPQTAHRPVTKASPLPARGSAGWHELRPATHCCPPASGRTPPPRLAASFARWIAGGARAEEAPAVFAADRCPAAAPEPRSHRRQEDRDRE